MPGDEAHVVEAFCSWLQSEGWTTQREIDFIDVVAERGGITLYAECKGRTSAIGLDVDTLYGQLLRRIPAQRSDELRLGVVVPTEAAAAALRVPSWVRQLLAVTIYAVDLNGTVMEISPQTPPCKPC